MSDTKNVTDSSTNESLVVIEEINETVAVENGEVSNNDKTGEVSEPETKKSDASIIELSDDTQKTCILCGRSAKLAGLMFQGIDHQYVCADCIKYAADMIDDYILHESDAEEEDRIRMMKEELFATCPKPIELKQWLDQYVIGQDEPKMTISTAIYNHYKRMAQTVEDDEVEIEKSNLLFVGKSGVGKTMIVKLLAKKLDIPVAIVDATKFTEAGYVGDDVETAISRLYQEADCDLQKAEYGIVVIDEGDKLGRKGENPSITKDVSGEGVQQGLLKLIEGSKVLFTTSGGRKHPNADIVEIDTTNILFVFMGAFEGLERNIARRLNTSSVGFVNNTKGVKIDKDDLMKYVTHDDLRCYGLMTELLGRFPILTHFDSLDKDALIRILTEPKNSIIKQYIKLFGMDGIKLSFDKDVYELIADKAMKCGLGARGLRTITEAIVKKAMYELPSSKKKSFKITRKYAEEQLANSHSVVAQELNYSNQKLA